MVSLSEAQAQDWRAATAAQITDWRQRHQAVQIQGHGSKAFYGQPVDAALPVLSTRDYTGVVAYDPSELVVVARAGTPLSALEKVLADQQQRLAFEPPRFSGQGTVGGMVASGLSGPGRLSAGPCKDYVLGLSVMSGEGGLLRFGGTVMKNVAGYDMSRLHTGAMGILGLILEVSLKVLPEPAAQRSIALACTCAQGIAWADQWLSEPLPISATAWVEDVSAVEDPEGPGSNRGAASQPSAGGAGGGAEGLLVVRFAGAKAAVDSAVERFQTAYGARPLEATQASSFWTHLRDQSHGFFSASQENPAVRLWRLSVPAQTADLSGEIPGRSLLEWGGALRWVWTDRPAEAVRAAAQAVGGHASLYRAATLDRQEVGCQSPLSPVLASLHRRIKAELDPHGLFNPGRLVAGL
jgi:glycolate oxidase FAD binding subunit